jgi:hypothetical protein
MICILMANLLLNDCCAAVGDTSRRLLNEKRGKKKRASRLKKSGET